MLRKKKNIRIEFIGQSKEQILQKKWDRKSSNLHSWLTGITELATFQDSFQFVRTGTVNMASRSR